MHSNRKVHELDHKELSLGNMLAYNNISIGSNYVQVYRINRILS